MRTLPDGQFSEIELVFIDTTSLYSKRKTAKDPSPLKVKEVLLDDRRYVVCPNEERRRKDAADREAIVERLREQLK